MGIAHCHAPGVLLLLLLLMLPCSESAEAHHESFPSSLKQEHVVVIAVAFTVTGLLLLGLVVWVLLKKKVKLGVVIMAGMNVAVVTVGMVAWIITYQEMRKAIEEQVDALLISRGSEAELTVKSVLDMGPIINDLHKHLLDLGQTTLHDVYPDPLLYLAGVSRTFEQYHNRSIDMVYYATMEKYMFAVEKPTSEGEVSRMMYVVPAGHTIPSDFMCKGDNNTVSHTACYGKSGKGRLLIYNAAGWETPRPRGTVLNAIDYDPTQRPWFALVDGGRWAEPYVSTEDDGFEFYLTATRAVRNSTGGWKGVAAVDYTIASLHPLMKELPPTENSVVILATVSGALASSSLNKSLILPPPGEKNSVRLVNESIPAIREPFEVLSGRFGSLEAAFKRGKAVLHEGGTAILFQPVAVAGGLDMVVVMTVPYGDVLGTSNDASTTALLLVLGVSIALCVVMAALVTVMMAPLGKLAEDMDKVAWMRVEEVPHRRGGITSELSWMNRSFQCMVNNLREYKQYLPQSVLRESELEEEVTEKVTTRGSSSDGSSGRGASSRPTSNTESTGNKGQHQRSVVFSSDLSVKMITVACINLRGTHSKLKQDPSAFLADYTRYMEWVLQASRSAKGIVDSVLGDRVMASFNAVCPNTSHRVKATGFALQCLSGMEGHGLQLSGGVCSGEARCGNTGCHGLKRFNCFGAVVVSAGQLERLGGSEWGTPLVADRGVYSHCEGTFEMKALHMMLLGHSKRPGLVYEVVSERKGGNEEWMYSLAESEVRGLVAYNRAVAAMYDGEFDEAMVILQKCDGGMADELLVRVRRCKDEGVPEPVLIPTVTTKTSAHTP